MEKCIVCGSGTAPQEGLHILGKPICAACERQILSTDAADPQYTAYMGKLKGVLVGGTARASGGPLF